MSASPLKQLVPKTTLLWLNKSGLRPVRRSPLLIRCYNTGLERLRQAGFLTYAEIPYSGQDVEAFKLKYPEAPVAHQMRSEEFCNNRVPLTNTSYESQVSVDELYPDSQYVASYLNSLGLQSCDSICLAVPNNSTKFMPIVVGATVQGIGIHVVNHSDSIEELRHRFKENNCKVVFCADSSLDKIVKAASECNEITRIVSVTPGYSHFTEDIPSLNVVPFADILAMNSMTHTQAPAKRAA